MVMAETPMCPSPALTTPMDMASTTPMASDLLSPPMDMEPPLLMSMSPDHTIPMAMESDTTNCRVPSKSFPLLLIICWTQPTAKI